MGRQKIRTLTPMRHVAQYSKNALPAGHRHQILTTSQAGGRTKESAWLRTIRQKQQTLRFATLAVANRHECLASHLISRTGRGMALGCTHHDSGPAVLQTSQLKCPG